MAKQDGKNRASTKRRRTVSIITLGCSKNVVDSEVLLRQIEANRLVIADDPNNTDTLIVNTCGFIDAAKEESIGVILQAAERKKLGKLRRLIVAGCLSERYRSELEKEIPEVDGFFGVTDFGRILEMLGGSYRTELLGERRLSTPSHFAWLKISEGCGNPCSFCAIPLMRGGLASRLPGDILAEARLLARQGVREVALIAQDTTAYGLDLFGERRLARLLEDLVKTDGLDWIRLMYAYPAKFPAEVLDVMREHASICRYIDIPVQHSSDSVLRSMRRGITRAATLELLRRIREKVPGVALRTSLIVGYPGETERDFEDLCGFVRELRFERLGVFAYSSEEGTPAAELGDPLPPAEKEARRSVIMDIQSEISLARNRSLIGATLKVLIDRIEDGMAVGRTEHDAPEIDNETHVPLESFSTRPLPGTFLSVRIVGADEHDLFGTNAE